MKKLLFFLVLVFAMISAEPCIASSEVPIEIPPENAAIKSALRTNRVAGEELRSYSQIKPFYESRNFAPVWTRDGKNTSNARELVNTIDSIYLDGLRPEFYHRGKIEELSGKPENSAELDLLFTDAYFMLTSHLSNGLIDVKSMKPVWFSKPEGVDPSWLLSEVAEGRSPVRKSLDQLKPKSVRYLMLRDLLEKYRKSAADGGWPTLPPFPDLPKNTKLEIGTRHPFVIDLRKRLSAIAPLPKVPPENEDLYDEAVAEAVRSFQRVYGLNEDGIAGKITVEMLSATVEERICQIQTNLDRLRAYDILLAGDKYLVVNIPGFELDLFERGKKAISMRVIVGTYKDKSPIMSDEMEFIVMSPKWHVPRSIAVKEELGKLRENPELFRRRGMRVYSGSGKERVEIDYENHDWNSVTADNFEYSFVQDPGAGNALGGIKFLFPNKDNVYLHDTPTKPLFSHDVRAFSHGCIRIEKPLDLAEYLLSPTEKWERDRIEKASKSGKEQMVSLPEKLPIHIIYLTAWVDEDGSHFRRDIYRYDSKAADVFCK